MDVRAAAKVATAQMRLRNGNTGSLKPVGEGVLESRIDFGPGYRVYLAFDGATLVILLGGGDKSWQGGDIAEAKRLWGEYRKRKKAETVRTKSPVKRTRER